MSVKFKRINVSGEHGQMNVSRFLEENNIKAEDVINISICENAVAKSNWWCITYNVKEVPLNWQGVCEDCDVSIATCKFVKELKDSDLDYCPHFVKPF